MASPTEIDLDDIEPPLTGQRQSPGSGESGQASDPSMLIPGLRITNSGAQSGTGTPGLGGGTVPGPPQLRTAADMVGVEQEQGGEHTSRVLDATRNMVADRLLPIYGDQRVGAAHSAAATNAPLGASEAALDDGLPYEATADTRASGHDNFLLSDFVGTGATDEATAMSAFKISSRFAAGRLFAAGSLENVVISIFFSHAVVWLLHELSGGNRLRVQFHHIPPQLYGAPYGALYEHVVEVEELVPMGLYRDGSHTNNALPYVQTNPGLDEFVREGDLLFVLAPKARFPRGQAADAIRLGTAAVAAAEVAAGSAPAPTKQQPRQPRAVSKAARQPAAAAAAAGDAKAEDSDDSFSE